MPAERIFRPKWKIPETAIVNPYEIDHPGIVTWKNRVNGFMVAAVHYTADPDKRSEEWFREATKIFRPDQIEREFEIDFDSRAGQRVFQYLTENPKRWRIPNINLHKLLKTKWRIIAALDYGTTNPTSIHFYAIDEMRRFYSVFEFYKPSNVREIARVLKGIEPGYEHPLWKRCERVVVDGAIFKKDQDTGGEGHDSIGDLLEEQGIYTMERATKDRIAGLERVKDMLRPATSDGLPSLYFCERCEHQWAELLGLVYDELPPHLLLNKNQKEDIVAKNDHCFVAGTMVSTPSGAVPIESLHTGDLVITRVGAKPVIAAGPTEIAQTYTLKFTNGSRLTCTANHPIWTENRGFVRADELSYEDLCVHLKSSFSMGLVFAGIRIRLAAMLDFISAPWALVENQNFSTGRYGNSTMGRFPKSITFTTKTGIRSITIQKISNVFRRPNTCQSTPESEATESERPGPRIEQGQQRGMGRSAENPGTANTPSAPGRRCQTFLSPVKFAGMDSLFRSLKRTLNFALGSVVNRTYGTGARLLWRRPGAVERVYNLTVEDQHEYFAEKILVHNSYDELRYALMAVESPSNLPPPPQPGEGTLGSVEKEMEIDDNRADKVDFV